MKWVVDTNVPVVANGQISIDDVEGVPKIQCRLNAVTFLNKLMQSHVVLLDLSGAIQEEYRTYLDPAGQPGVGDQFYREILNSDPKRIRRVELPLRENGEYRDCPDLLINTGFDPSDRKFAALANKENANVANATDSDWINHSVELADCDIHVENLCGCDPEDWYQ